MTNTISARAVDPLVMGFWRLLDWNLTSQQCLSYLQQCIELGITDTDHADIYGQYECEVAFGKALKLDPQVREHIRIITKCGIRPALAKKGLAGKANHYDSSKAHIISSVQQSLKNLETDRIDLLLIHRPDYLMVADEVAEAFAELKRNGDVDAFGVSNFNIAQFELLQSRCEMPLVTNQIECSPYHMQALEDGTLEQCQQKGINPMFWSPLAGGKLFANDDEKAARLQACLTQVAQEIGAQGIDQVVYAWLHALPSQPAIVLGTSNITRVQSAVESQQLRLNREQWYRIWSASTGRSVA